MGKIKVTGYLFIEDFEDDELDLNDPSGLSATGFDNLLYGSFPMPLSSLDDIQFELEL